MPPRHAYWTILIDNLPTAFRAARVEELQPTFERLRRKHPTAVMRWFARGRLWESPDAARRPQPRPAGRGKDWRPGGAHRDPRQRAERPSRWRAIRERRKAGGQTPERARGTGTAARPTRAKSGGHGPSRRPAATGRSETPTRRQPRPHDEQPGLPPPPPPQPPPGPDRPPRPGAEPEPLPSSTEEIVIPPEPPERGTAPRAPRPRPPRRR